MLVALPMLLTQPGTAAAWKKQGIVNIGRGTELHTSTMHL
jgi:hypothetical protein